MEIVIIAAVAENGVIGKAGRLPWHIPEDMKRFKELTLGHCVIMGRKTFESLGKPLPDRTNIVMTARQTYHHQGVLVAGSFDDAMSKCTGDTVFIIGGSRVFEEALPLAHRLELTLVHRVVEGDVYFPPIGADWEEVKREDHEGFSFVTYVKK